MLSDNQIKSLSEEELAYLVICFENEWKQIGMPYEFKFNYIKLFRNNAIQHILNKYSSNLKDECKNIVINILNKLEVNS